MAQSRPLIRQPLLIWLAMSILSLLPAAVASAATIRASVQPNPVRPNQTFTFVITVENGSVERLSELRLPVQLQQVSGVSSSQQYSVVNGRQTASIRLAWQLVASEPGDFVIPPQFLKVEGEDISTNEVKLTVMQGGGDDSSFGNEDDSTRAILQLELGKKEIYQGEVMPLNCSLYIPRDMQLRRFSGLIDIEKNDLAIARFPQGADQSMTVINGVGYTVLTFRSTLSSLKTGEITVGPASLEILVEVPVERERRPNMFPPGFPQGFFGVPTEPRKVLVKSQPVKLNVLPLPSEGRPENFSGAVGDFVLTASATPTELTVGDPVAVELIVEGSGNFDALTTPALTLPSGWKSYPAKRYSIEGQIDQNQVPTLDRKIGYSQVFIPEAVHSSLPPFELTYFSSSQKKYVTLRTEPIPLNMKPAPAEAGGGQVTAGITSQEFVPPVTDPVPDITDIIINPPPNSRWLLPTGNLLIRSSTFWSVQAVPVALLALACLVAVLRRKRETQLAGRAGELRTAWSGLERHGLDDEEFLRRSARFIYLAKGAEPVNEPELRAILDRYQARNFSVGQGDSLGSSERQKWLQNLRALYRNSMAKATVAVLALLCLGGNLNAQDQAEADKIYQEAVTEMEKGNYSRAQYHAESLTKKKPPFLSAEVFQLIGHARYRQEDLGRAVLWYERARLLDAQSPELRQNLRHLHEKLRYVSFQTENPLRELSLWLKPNQWITMAAVGGWLVCLSLAFRVLAGRRGGSGAVVFSVVGLLIAIPASAMAVLRPAGLERTHHISVITAKDVSAFTGASVTSGTVIDLPEGSQVRLLEQRGAWNYVEIPSRPENLRGWVENAALTPLWPWDDSLVP